MSFFSSVPSYFVSFCSFHHVSFRFVSFHFTLFPYILSVCLDVLQYNTLYSSTVCVSEERQARFLF